MLGRSFTASGVRAALLSAVLALAGCSFQLRGTAQLPFETIYVPRATAGVALELKRNIQSGTSSKVIDDPKQAQAILEFIDETRLKEILSLTGAGRVREFRLGYRVSYRVRDRTAGEYVAPTTLQLSRDVTYSDADVLAKQEEEEILYRDMQSDAVRQIVRRLSAAHAPTK